MTEYELLNPTDDLYIHMKTPGKTFLVTNDGTFKVVVERELDSENYKLVLIKEEK